MTKKITLTINGSRFDIDVDAAFADYLQEQVDRDFNTEANNNFKTLLQAYVRKNYECFENESVLKNILNNLENNI